MKNEVKQKIKSFQGEFWGALAYFLWGHSGLVSLMNGKIKGECP